MYNHTNLYIFFFYLIRINLIYNPFSNNKELQHDKQKLQTESYDLTCVKNKIDTHLGLFTSMQFKFVSRERYDTNINFFSIYQQNAFANCIIFNLIVWYYVIRSWLLVYLPAACCIGYLGVGSYTRCTLYVRIIIVDVRPRRVTTFPHRLNGPALK